MEVNYLKIFIITLGRAVPSICRLFGHLTENSPAVDFGAPYLHDGNMPPGIGLISADIGAYGGPKNIGWGGDTIPNGSAMIDHIVDLPQDQGGVVGVQYSASLFDYAHTGYDIEEYTFWRELNVQNRSTPFLTDSIHYANSDIFNTGRNNYWELIGNQTAQGFENYGFSAETIADSSADGVFWSKFLVVAHTPDDDIFFVSDPDSGYSVDNIAPTPPATVNSAFDDGILTVVWEDEVNPDIAHYEVFKQDTMYVESTELQFNDVFELGDERVYKIRGVDENDNVGDFSEPFNIAYGERGDINWDGTINILDVTNIIHNILFPNEDLSSEEFWAGDFNGDNEIDIVDVTPVVDIILGGLLSSMGSEGGEPVVLLDENVLFLSSSRPITGVQIRMSEASSFTNLTNLNIATEGDQVLLYTLSGNVLQGDHIPLLSLESDVIIEEMILVDNMGERVSSVLSVTEDAKVPEEFAVHQNYPNPFNPSTLIRLDANKAMHTSIFVYDIMGREIKSLVSKELEAGYHQFIWDGMDQKEIR